MLPQAALPNLFYLLASTGQVSLGRLVRALRYQAALPQGVSSGFCQILTGLQSVPSLLLHRLRQDYGKLDEEPLAALLVDSGRLTPAQLQRVRTELGSAPVAVVPWLLGQGLLSAEQLRILLDDLGALAELSGPGVQDVLRLREQGLRLFKRQLWESGLLRQEEMGRLGLWPLTHVPLKFKPLLDVLVLEGFFPAYLSPVLLIEQVSFYQEPLLVLAECLQLCAADRIRAGVQVGPHTHPAFWLVEVQGLKRQRLVRAIAEVYRWSLRHSDTSAKQNRPFAGAV
ncbi:MAG: hypothetical protein ACO1RX_19640 [Candidatus Sericytochromatia bacterium]